MKTVKAPSTPKSKPVTNELAPKSNKLDGNESVLQAIKELLERGVTASTRAKVKTSRPYSKSPTEEGVQILIWEDDPFLSAVIGSQPVPAEPIAVEAPINEHERLQTEILGDQPDADTYDPSTSTREFLFWNTASALARGINFWAPLLPEGTLWSTNGHPMRVELDAGIDLNAYYSRNQGLVFFHDEIEGNTVFSAESPDVVCHELGHAILDALKPELFDAMSSEVGAFHEALGDISAILSALQLPTMREFVLEQTGGDLALNSRLSQLARELGWAIRTFAPSAVDNDSLRNAANSFFYQDPNTLPPSAPANELSSEVHSFSRVFTGAFLDVLAGMFEIGPANSARSDSDKLAAISTDIGKLLVEGIRIAAVGSGFYGQVAAGMIAADQYLFGSRYCAALTSSFVRRGIISVESGVGLVRDLRAQAGAAFGVTGAARSQSLQFEGDNEGFKKTGEETPELPLRMLTTQFGTAFHVHMPSEPNRFGISAAAIQGGSDVTTSNEDAARAYVEDLIQNGRIAQGESVSAIPPELMAPGEPYPSDHTHELVRKDGKVILKRRHFDCGFCRSRRRRLGE